MNKENCKFAKEIQTFIAESKTRLQNILKRLNWNTAKTSSSEDVQTGGEQERTVLSEDLEPELPSSCATKNSVVTDINELRIIVADDSKEIPKKFSELQVNFTREQKLRIYEHVVANTEKMTEPEIIGPTIGDNALTFAEIVANKKRESKKRRRYRRSKPTHTELVRAVLDLQMQALQQYLSTSAIACRRERQHLDTEAKEQRYQRQGRSPQSNRAYDNHNRISTCSSNKRYSSRSSRHRSCSKDKHHQYGPNRMRSRSREHKNSYKNHSNSKNHQHDGDTNRHRNRSRSRSKHHIHKSSRSDSLHKYKKSMDYVRDRSKSKERKKNKKRRRSKSHSRNFGKVRSRSSSLEYRYKKEHRQKKSKRSRTERREQGN